LVIHFSGTTIISILIYFIFSYLNIINKNNFLLTIYKMVANPNARKGYPGASNSLIANQFTAGGTAKAGTGLHIGMGPFVYAAIAHGAAGHPAPTVSGLAYFSVYRRHYPNPPTNQIGGVGRMPRWGMFNTMADGVNTDVHRAQNARIAAGPGRWGLPSA
jgi:hypothetical protein